MRNPVVSGVVSLLSSPTLADKRIKWEDTLMKQSIFLWKFMYLRGSTSDEENSNRF